MKRLVWVDTEGRKSITPPGTVARLKYPGCGGGGGGFTVSNLESIELFDDEEAAPVVFPIYDPEQPEYRGES